MPLFLLLLSFPVLFTVAFFFHGSLLLFFLQLFDVFIPFLSLLLLGQARRVPRFVLFLETGGIISSSANGSCYLKTLENTSKTKSISSDVT